MSKDLHISEYDEAAHLAATYRVSELAGSQRTDLLQTGISKSIWSQILDVFLPAGFPNSVTEDYVEYQIYDSLQAFASTIAGLLSSRAVLEGVGVGDASASPTAALLLSILQESTGRLATILFAHRLGTTLEPECKMYRLAADVFNDAAMILDCLSPAFPKVARVIILSTSSTLRALCGVAAGSSKASLSAHFARWGNLGELNAKDSSQETVISLVGMLCGSFIVSQIKSTFATWLTLLALLLLHLYLNYAAVKAVRMQTLNRQRANIVFSHLIEAGKVLGPREVSRCERIFEGDGVLRWHGTRVLGHGFIGVSCKKVLGAIARTRHSSGSLADFKTHLGAWQAIFSDCGYLLWFDAKTRTAFALLKRGAPPRAQLEAWTHGLLMAKRADRSGVSDHEVDTLDRLRSERKAVKDLFDSHLTALEAAGWDMQNPALETTSGMRVEFACAP